MQPRMLCGSVIYFKILTLLKAKLESQTQPIWD